MWKHWYLYINKKSDTTYISQLSAFYCPSEDASHGFPKRVKSIRKTHCVIYKDWAGAAHLSECGCRTYNLWIIQCLLNEICLEWAVVLFNFLAWYSARSKNCLDYNSSNGLFSSEFTLWQYNNSTIISFKN